MRVLLLSLGFYAASALRIQAYLKDAAVPSNGIAGTIAFGKVTAPIYDVSDEPFQNIRFAGIHGVARNGADASGEMDGPGNTNPNNRGGYIAAAMKECTPEVGQKLSEKYPAGPIPKPARTYLAKNVSSLPENSFYASEAVKSKTWGCTGASCQVPTYVPARERAKGSQKIPRIVWMTVTDKLLNGEAGPFQYNQLVEHSDLNPEYEWIVSGDAASDAFMKTDEVKKEWQTAYSKARNGAEKADIWRYAVMYKYGGVYMDSDMKAHAPYKTFLDPDSDIVQALSVKGSSLGKWETSQFGLFMRAGHPLMEKLLDTIAEKFTSGKPITQLTLHLTGPGALGRLYLQMAAHCGLKGGGNPGKVYGKPM